MLETVCANTEPLLLALILIPGISWVLCFIVAIVVGNIEELREDHYNRTNKDPTRDYKTFLKEKANEKTAQSVIDEFVMRESLRSLRKVLKDPK
jgi:hypothetical protein